MRDGVTLYADIYKPRKEGVYPVLLMRQPYGRKIASTVSHAHPVWYASHGYIVVIQDVRGRGDSEGEFTPFLHEAEDGYDTVEWAAALPESNGKVGMYGFSYQGAVQWAAASLHPPHLTAIAPSMTAADLYRGWMYPYGSFDIQSCLPWAYQLARDGARLAGDAEAEAICTHVMQNPSAVLNKLPLIGDHPVLQTYMPAFFDWAGRSEDDEYWSRLNWMDPFLQQPIPALHIGGWYDFLLHGTLQSYAALQRAGGRTPELFHRLEIGPWTHIPWGRKAGGVDHGPEADGLMHLKQIEWFDYWLKEKRGNGLFEEPPVRYYETCSRRWRTADRLPDTADGEAAQRYYLSGSELPANGSLGGGKLTRHVEWIDESAAPDVFVYDARLAMPLSSVLPVDRSAQQDRYEILVYSSPPLSEALGLFGSPQVKAVCQVMDGPTDLVAVLSLVLPGEEARFLSVGRVEIGAAGGAEGVSGWQAVQFGLRPLAVRCPEGSRLRLELTGSGYPLLLRHPNGMSIRDGIHAGLQELNIAAVAVMSRPGEESWLELPVAEAAGV
ncbi:CocE/NonD family hydrolase [Paenibacillus chartarius]|uniref:CocE/NonD family hydrolase n=1 Tax=Paenibacillus chartarius TaxID=747481 RepID=A0ABV6DH16_9BACL